MSEFIVPLAKFGAGIGLHRVAAIADNLGLDLAGFGARGCVITGSNGKGSVAAMSAAILSASGARVGRFTSPHLFSIRERFAIDGADIAPPALARHWSRVLEAARAYERQHSGDHVGGFEFLFLIAASWFAEEACAFTVWEAGIGGRYDPTRLIGARNCALVSLDLEHTNLLGATLEEIAYDKLDAAPPGARILIGENAAPLEARLAAYCALRGLTPEFLRAEQDWRLTESGADILLRAAEPIAVAPPLAGLHQHNNTALAVRLARNLLGGALHASAIRGGLAATNWPGRLETISTAPPVVVDVGHTPAAILAARAGFEAMHAPAVLVCGASVDKPADAIIAALAPGFRVVVCAQAAHKGRAPAEIAALAQAANPSAQVITAPSMTDAHRVAIEHAAGGAVYVAGGLFLAAEFKAVHLGLNPAALHFF